MTSKIRNQVGNPDAIMHFCNGETLEKHDLRERETLNELQGILNWGEKYGDNMIKGFIQARITHIKREIKEYRKQGD